MIPHLGIYPGDIKTCDHASIQNVKELLQLNNRRQPDFKMAENLNRHFFKEDTQMANKYMKRCAASLVIRKCKSKAQ